MKMIYRNLNILLLGIFISSCADTGQERDQFVQELLQKMSLDEKVGQMTQVDKRMLDKGVFVKFPLKDKENENILIWTTTPWTLSSNIAVAVNKKINYAKIKAHDGTIYFVAETNLKYQRKQ